jgi:hypothetical protein
LLGIEQRDLDAVDLRGVLADQRQHRLHRVAEVAAAPIARERRIEHSPSQCRITFPLHCRISRP